eukprot:s2141_g1.t1
MSMLCDIKQSHKTFATLDIKAAETKHFLHAFIPVAKELLTMDLVEEKAMLQALDAISRIIKVHDDADAFLTEAEWLKGLMVRLVGDARRHFRSDGPVVAEAQLSSMGTADLQKLCGAAGIPIKQHGVGKLKTNKEMVQDLMRDLGC